MSTDTLIAIAIFIFLISTIWKLNSTQTKSKNRVGSKVKQQRNNVQPNHSQLYDGPSGALNGIDESTQLSSQLEVPEAFLAFKLMNSKRLDDQQQKLITEINQCFRKPHPLLLPLIQGGFEPTELFDLIKTDAEMTAKILNAVNSPLFALRQPITNINHAIIFLGITEVKNIALQFAVKNNIKIKNDAQNEVYKKLWLASSMASSFCLLFAKKLGNENAAELSTHCLLSYLGDLAALSYKPSIASFYVGNYSLFERTKTFQETLGINVAIIGKSLANQWQLPKSIEVGIERSLSLLTNDVVSQPLSSIEMQHALICYVCCRLGDLVAFNGIRDISQLGEISFQSLEEIEFYYIQENINQVGLNKMNTIFADSVFRSKMNKIIQQASG